ncbi:5-oxoprolinase/urea amidolyase family protein [Bacillus suaedaesalsae]|uniref:Biotin-dependent carboxyltransferase family protein n=1 Tax=Bacillus suaedaesalsae TaxID=2810349 RepID=A0ABS2DEC6_9BACI|nr:biotin-dependent carboxyltransferase family protein [Bacillus suaedaesalsae]
MSRKPIIHIEKTGLATSFQDKGRYGFQRYGVVTSGAMDSFAFQTANGLVGNPLNAVCLELCIVGPTLTFLDTVTFAICGANLSPILNSTPILGWRTYTAKRGDTLEFGKQIEGTFAYLAIRGSFEVEEVLGSKSTYTKAEIGTTVTPKTIYYSTHSTLLKRNRGLIQKEIPTYHHHIEVRYIRGPHLDYLQEDAVSNFEEQIFTYTLGDRMGFRLQGESPIQSKQQSLPSDPIPLGGIQIPPDGCPIVLLADRQTTGGYPRIGTIISYDIPKFVQLPLQGKVSFYPISVEKAQQLHRRSIFTYN